MFRPSQVSYRISIFLGFIGLIVNAACKTESKTGKLKFTRLDSGQTGIYFNNEIIEDDSLNFYHNEYIYIGSGVGVGDFNNDGLQDVFFGGSQVDSKLYLNKGDFKFEDITERSGIAGKTEWVTGVTVEDVNQDGWDDLYLCVSHFSNPKRRKNLLFINQKSAEVKFQESAESYGLADTGYSTNAAFFDYDKDGDLDMYLLNHKLFDPEPNRIVRIDTSGLSKSADKLFRNEGVQDSLGHPVFVDVSIASGIKEDGYGLGIMVADINEDNYPDIYVANDYLSNDYLWINDKKGGFVNRISEATRHQSFSSMGIDIADINNDLLLDIGVLDMMPNTNERKKMMSLGFSPDKYEMQRWAGYHHQYSRNVLQLNQGMMPAGIPAFSEIGQLAGISETDWSWSILFADFNNDTWKDIHISNGLGKDLTNNDFISFTQSELSEKSFFGANSAQSVSQEDVMKWAKRLDEFGSVEKQNFLFLNNKSLIFEDQSGLLGANEKTVSQGAAYADFDNDGDLDLVVNNMNQEALILRNDLRITSQDSVANFLRIKLSGLPSNLHAVGAKVLVYTQGTSQIQEQFSTRGYASSVDKRLHFGLGDHISADSVRIIWPTGKSRLLQNIAANQEILVSEHEEDDLNYLVNLTNSLESVYMEEVNHAELKAHSEKFFADFSMRRMQPQKYSQLGPGMALADVNGDGLDDFFMAGPKGQASGIYIQTKTKTYQKSSLPESIEPEDLNGVFIDVDSDGDQDLIVVGGSTELPGSGAQAPRVYLNDSKGKFSLSMSLFDPGFKVFSSTILAEDFDEDGDKDLFIGGRLDNDIFPESPQSYVLENRSGKFVDVTRQKAAELSTIGMVTSGLFLDFDDDGRQDLVLCGDYMSVEFFKNTGSVFKKVTNATGLTSNHGWWRSLKSADLDNDGDVDLIAGNFGENTKYHLSSEKPAYLYAKDLDKNGSMELLPAYYIKDDSEEYKLFTDLSRDQFAEQTPLIKQRFPRYEEYSKAEMKEMLKYFGQDDFTELRCEYLSSAWFENVGKGKYVRHELPQQAQFAPVNAIQVLDLNEDGFMDLLLAGNEYHAEVSTGRYDASYGTILLNRKGSGWQSVPPYLSGLFLKGDVRSMLLVNNGMDLVVGVNNSHPMYFKIKR